MTSPPINVAEYLVRAAAERPDAPAVHTPYRGGYRTLTFHELNADADALAHGLAAAGIGRGTRTAVMVPPGPDFFALTFAFFKLAAVPVLIDPGMGIKNLGICLAEAEPEAFVGVAKAHLACRLFRWAKRSIRTTVNVGRSRFFCTHSTNELRTLGSPRGPYPTPDVSEEEMAAILFTSGSTGVAKGAVYTHGIFAAQVRMLKAIYGIEPGEVDLCTFPLFALFGPALGMTCVVPEMNPSRPSTIDPAKAVAAIEKFRVTNLFGSPAVIRRLADYGKPLPTLRRAISAGAPASLDVTGRFAKLLPEGVEVFTPYGATESLPVANIGSREILGETRHLTTQGKGICIGKPVAGMTVAVVRITDEAIAEWDDSLVVPPGEVGEFVVRGPVVTKAYYHRDEATRLAKIRDPKTNEVLHRMGDVGYVDAIGRLWFCGRKSHRVETPGGTLFTDMVEPIFNTVAFISRTALVGVKRNGVSHPVLCYEVLLVKGPSQDFEALMREKAAKHEMTCRISTFLRYPKMSGFPVDVRHNSKIFREKLAVWADKKLGPNWAGPGA
jgi:acyl-CoA synthetase (AMP-forming)/AMP-acid ligase II